MSNTYPSTYQVYNVLLASSVPTVSYSISSFDGAIVDCAYSTTKCTVSMTTSANYNVGCTIFSFSNKVRAISANEVIVTFD